MSDSSALKWCCSLDKRSDNLALASQDHHLSTESLFIDTYSQNVLTVTLGRLKERPVLRTAGQRCHIVRLKTTKVWVHCESRSRKNLHCPKICYILVWLQTIKVIVRFKNGSFNNKNKCLKWSSLIWVIRNALLFFSLKLVLVFGNVLVFFVSSYHV